MAARSRWRGLFDEVSKLKSRLSADPENQALWSEVERRFDELWHEHHAGEAASPLPADQLLWLATLGVTLARRDGRLADASELLRTYLDHLEQEQDDWVSRVSAAAEYGELRLRCGAEEEAVESFRHAIGVPRKKSGDRSCRIIIRQRLLEAFRHAPRATVPGGELVELVEEVSWWSLPGRQPWVRPSEPLCYANLEAQLHVAWLADAPPGSEP